MGSSPIRGIRPIFSEEYVEWENDAHIHIGLILKKVVASVKVRFLVVHFNWLDLVQYTEQEKTLLLNINFV